MRGSRRYFSPWPMADCVENHSWTPEDWFTGLVPIRSGKPHPTNVGISLCEQPMQFAFKGQMTSVPTVTVNGRIGWWFRI